MVMLSSLKVKTVPSSTGFNSVKISAFKRVLRGVNSLRVPGLEGLKVLGLRPTKGVTNIRGPGKQCARLNRTDGKGSAVAKR